MSDITPTYKKMNIMNARRKLFYRNLNFKELEIA